ncbi:DEAD/DEAH box helicase [Desulfopila sp. IMCC35006]|uniref:DEAD/DEAH box helicase n=1 Tax=Desulfopila sp. IMCC35006 TaxID=2569542 RepID=UPI0010AB88D6|nr:DEAD/DEAH box helicase [Desulfopila sp. IMCC35006]TKB28611.1 DEAD/DEAH box helicase [Desulfopila sp. IMCC35006]
MSSEYESTPFSFTDFDLSAPLLQAVNDAGYETPTPIQQEMIPHVLAGRDVVGQAQTGTGKTAAFALPLLSRLQPGKSKNPQILVLAPTRELALQVAESFTEYGKHLKNFNVLAIFGGQDYNIQLRQLQKGVQVVVGTPGRVMDHLRRGTLKPESIHSLVLDEADEMLRMGFLDDVEWILEQLPGRKQTALFSATMPPNIRKIAQKYLSDPVEITIKTKAVTAQTINQRCLVTTGGFTKKIDALSRIIEAESVDGILVFVRTKIQTVEIAEHLVALGFSAAPLNGDIQQSQRLRTVEQLKAKKIDILVATDVAARGLDVERISHVINFDIPFDTESYIHRIGRTGRAGRSGEAILFVNPREQSMLRSIERATRQKIQPMNLPSVADINKKRIEQFKEKITTALQKDISFYENLIAEYLEQTQVEPLQLAAALAQLSQGGTPLLKDEPKFRDEPAPASRRSQPVKTARTARPAEQRPKPRKSMAMQLPPEEGMERFRIQLGNNEGVKPGNIVGAIANEADINSKFIGRISIFDNYSTVDLPFGMPEDVLRVLQRARIGSKAMKLQKIADTTSQPSIQQKTKRRSADTRKQDQIKTPGISANL